MNKTIFNECGFETKIYCTISLVYKMDLKFDEACDSNTK